MRRYDLQSGLWMSVLTLLIVGSLTLPPTTATAKSYAHATLSLDLVPDGGWSNQIDDGVTAGTVSGQGTTIAIEVFAKGVTTPLQGMVIKFDFDASILTFVKAENSAFALSIPESDKTGTNLAATAPVTLWSSGFLARAEFTTAVDVTDREFSIGIKEVTLVENALSSDVITTTNAISFNANDATPSLDFDGDGSVGMSDFLLFTNHFGQVVGNAGYDAKYDLDGDDAIGMSDFLIFTEHFGTEVPPSGDGGPPPGTDFDLDPDNGSPSGITYANNRFYVVDGIDDKVYMYTSSGPRNANFDLDSDNGSPSGIAYANNRLYVVDETDEKVYVYASSGQRVASEDFDLDSANSYPTGITYANNRFYVLDAALSSRNNFRPRVYVYTNSGQRDTGADLYLYGANNGQTGIAYANNRFYVVDSLGDKVYVYTNSGQRVSSEDFNLHSDNDRPTDIAYANNRFYVLERDDTKVYVYTSSGQSGSTGGGSGGGGGSPDLIVDSPSVSDSTLTTGQSFTLSATVRNQGQGSSASTTLRYYRSSNATISTSDTEVGTDSVSGLSASSTSAESISLTAPSSAGTYYYGACVASVSGESDTNNNCSDGVRVTVSSTGGGGSSNSPDLIVDSPSVSDSTLTSGQAFTLSATVRNQGTGSSASTTLRYYRSSNSTISTSDTEVGTDSVDGLSASGTSAESISLNAPSNAGTYYYGACVTSVSGESDTNNNCSSAVRVTVSQTTSGFAPADQQAFNSLVVGKRILAGTYFFDFESAGRFTESFGRNQGSYTYSNTGANTSTLTLNYDGELRCTTQLTFTSTTTGTISTTCNDRVIFEDLRWQLSDLTTPLFVRANADTLVFAFLDTWSAGETRAYDYQVRQKTPQGDWEEACGTQSNELGHSVTTYLPLRISGTEPNTTYEVRYRYRNSSSCNTGSPGPWSAIAEGTTPGSGSGSGSGGGGGNTYGVGESLPNFPSGFFVPRRLSGASLRSSGGRTVISFNNGGFVELQDGTIYTCIASGGCSIESGRVTAGTFRVTQ